MSMDIYPQSIIQWLPNLHPYLHMSYRSMVGLTCWFERCASMLYPLLQSIPPIAENYLCPPILGGVGIMLAPTTPYCTEYSLR